MLITQFTKIRPSDSFRGVGSQMVLAAKNRHHERLCEGTEVNSCNSKTITGLYLKTTFGQEI
jgi:hypothetical protein